MSAKNTKLIKVLLGLSVLVGCGTTAEMAPVGLNSALNNRSALQSFSAPGNALSMVDNYTRFMARQNDGSESQPPMPVDGQKAASLPAAGGQKALTYMTYEALDNNLFQDLNRILDTLELVGSNASMNLLAQTDNFGPGNSARYYLTQERNMGQIKSPFTALGPQFENSGDPRVLTDAVKWGFSTFPSRMSWLNMSTHGMGFAGISYDDDPEASMNIVNFAQSVRQGIPKKLDVISFDACLMATVEVGSELQDVSNILVGSEDSTFYWGYGYYATFSKMAQNPNNINLDQVVRSMVMDVNNTKAMQQTLTVSATDLRKISQLESAMDGLARALRQALPKYRAPITMALKASKPFAMAQDIPFRDINRVVSLLKERVTDPAVREACDKVNDVLYRKGVIMFSRQNKQEQGQGRGLSVYVPMEGKVSELYRQTRFAKTTQWDEFLVDLNAGLAPAQP